MEEDEFMSMKEFISTKEVIAWLGISIPTLRSWYERGEFPKPIFISPRKMRWRKNVILEWLAEKEEQSKNGN